MTTLNSKVITEKFFGKKRIAIVGASGYIGSKLVVALSKFDCVVLRITRDKNKLNPILDTLANIIDYEINYDNIDWHSVLENVDIVYYLSAQTSIYIAEKNIVKDYNSSVKPIVKLLEYCEEYKNKLTIVFSSAVSIYGLTEFLPVDESYNDKPITIYDIHKLLIENYIKFYASKNIIKGVSLRLANVYGQGVESSSSDRGILNKMISRAIEGHDLSVFGEGSYKRDYIYIDDVVDAFLKAAIHIEKTNTNHYIIATGEGTRIKDSFSLVSKKVYDILKIDTDVGHVDAPDSLSLIEYRNFVGNCNSFEKATGWNNHIKLEDGVEKMIHYIKGVK